MSGIHSSFLDRKRIAAIAAAAAVVAALAVAGSVETKKPVQADGLPQAAQTFMATYCAGEVPVLVLREYDDFRRSYEATLVDGTKIKFRRSGEWTSFESHARPVPAALVPAQVTEYLEANFPGAVVKEISRDRREIEVGLDNRVELTFDSKTFLLTDFDD